MPKGHWDWSMPVPFSQGWAVKDCKLILVGGQISADEHGRTVGVGDIETQTRNAFEGIRRVLREAGADMQDIVESTRSTFSTGTATRSPSTGRR
jgi:enamine deaminase RidA (YjgF/YER057c/UK114 family)